MMNLQITLYTDDQKVMENPLPEDHVSDPGEVEDHSSGPAASQREKQDY